MIESRVNIRMQGDSSTYRSVPNSNVVDEKAQQESQRLKGKRLNFLQSHVETRAALPLDQANGRFDQSEIEETDMQLISLNEEPTIEFELPALNEPKHGNTLFETIKENPREPKSS